MRSTGFYAKATTCSSPHLNPSRDTSGGSGAEHSTTPRAGGGPFQSSVFSAVPYTRMMAKLSMAALNSNATHFLSQARVAEPLSSSQTGSSQTDSVQGHRRRLVGAKDNLKDSVCS